MPNSGVYRLAVATTGIQGTGSECQAVIIPGGALIHVRGAFNDSFMECVWDGEQITVLTLDIKERGTLVESTSA